eukprot:symbB.v1.2.007352.t1/scaffold425.1/size368629/16
MSDGKVVEAECAESHLTSGSAEHQKYSTDTADKYSSPFAFSQAGHEVAYTNVIAPTGPATTPNTYLPGGPPVGTAPVTPQSGGSFPANEMVHLTWQEGQVPQMQQLLMQVPMNGTIGMSMQSMPMPMQGTNGMPMPMNGMTGMSMPMPGATPTGPVVEGWLSKRAQDMSKSWLNRWFVLTNDGVLRYGKEQTSQDMKKIFLDKLTKVRPLIHPTATDEGRRIGVKKPFGIEIFQGAGRRTWYLDAGSKEKRDLWLNSLQMVLVQTGAAAGGYS